MPMGQIFLGAYAWLREHTDGILGAVTSAVVVLWVVRFGFFTSESVSTVARTLLGVCFGLFVLGNLLRLSWLPLRPIQGWLRVLVPLVVALIAAIVWGSAYTAFQGLLVNTGYIPETFLRNVPLAVFVLTELGTTRRFQLFRLRLNPATLFVLSFIVLIVVGTGLLSLPRATASTLSFLDTLFTSTSAACVTGLIVVDTATAFTTTGKAILLFIIQVGGLGIITFTYFFSFVFQGSASLQSTIAMRSMLSAENIGGTLRTILRIVVITLSVELAGAVLLWFALGGNFPLTGVEKFGFVVFHAVSAVCNAGFSTLSAGLFDTHVSHNYAFQLVIILLVILGGIGFTVLTGLGRSIKAWFVTLFLRVLRGERRHFPGASLTVNNRLVLRTTFWLLLVGFVAFAVLEYDGILKSHGTWAGKITTALFASVTPRTAGFNTFDLTAVSIPALLVITGLMWIGASPGSTGGGIKTTTFALAVLNFLNVARGKSRIEFGRRQVAAESVQKAFSVIILSLLLIVSAATVLTYTDPGIAPHKLFFEVVSAVGTVGLSLNVTPFLSDAGKVVIIFCMFLGRVGMLTILTAIARQVLSSRYRYPEQTVQVG